MHEQTRLFLQYIKDVRGLSESTHKSYKNDLKQVFRVVDCSPSELTNMHIQSFVSSQKKRNMKARTINRRLAAVSMLVDYLINEAEITMKNPVKREYHQKMKDKNASRDNRVFPEDGTKMLEWARKNDHTSYVLLILMGKAGLRVSEVRKLRVEHVDFETNVLNIKNSKSQDRKVPMAESIAKAIKKEIGMRIDGFVLTKGSGEGYKATGALWRKTKKVMKVFDVKGACHSWRRGSGSNLYKATKDIVFVQRFLGHGNPSVTEASYLGTEETDKTTLKKIEEIF